MLRQFEMLIYFAVILQMVILEISKDYPNTFGTEFVTLFPWSKKVSNTTHLTLEIINASENDTATVIIEYDIGLRKSGNMMQFPQDVFNIKPNSYITCEFDAATKMIRPYEGSQNIIPAGASRIFISSSLPVSIVECIFFTQKIGDCFTVIPITMAGNYYSFSISSSTFNGISTAFFIPTHTDSQINVTSITKKGLQRIRRILHFDRGSMIYAYNSSINGSFTVYISSSFPIVILLAMRTYLRKISDESFACTMLIPLPDKVSSQIALRDDFDAHFTPLESSGDYRTQLLLAAPIQNCQPFTVATFRPNSTRLINIEPNIITDEIAIEWNFRKNDAIVGYSSNNTLFQLLRFEIYQNLYSFLDIIPAYSQYLTGRMCFHFKNESERLFLYDISRQLDTLLLDGKAINAEYIQYFENPFRYITMRKINTKKLKRGLHCLESNGRYLLFIFGGSEKNYGYVYAFNAYPIKILKLMMRSDPSSYRQDIFGVSFITLFPWMIISTDNSSTNLTLDIVNPHPYMIARVEISYHNDTNGDLIEMIYNIKPYTHHMLEMNKIMMTKLDDAHNNGIYKSNYDSRIMITSSIPISVTQNCFFHNKIGDSFAVLPLTMAGKNYSFSIPKSINNDSHAIIYFLTFNQTTKISIIAKVNEEEKFYNIEAETEKNSSIFAYYGSGEELSMNLWSDNPFQVIIALQQLLIIPGNTDIERRPDFASTMAVPVLQNVCSMEKHKDWYDLHYLFVAQHDNYSGFFTMTPSDTKCSSYYADLFPRKQPLIKEQQRLTFEPATMKHYFQLSAEIFSDFSTIYCRNDNIQIYAFGSSNLEGNYIDFVPSVLQYVTGRSHFVAHHYQNWVLIFMDKDAINDIEMDGVFIGANYVYEMLSATNSGYFALQAVHSTIRLHYVQSTGHYAVHVLSDTLANGFYQYFVTLNRYPNLAEKNAMIRESSNRKSEFELFPELSSTSKNIFKPVGIVDSNAIALSHKFVADAKGEQK